MTPTEVFSACHDQFTVTIRTQNVFDIYCMIHVDIY